MPEGWSGGGEGLQNDGDEKREEMEGSERREIQRKGWRESQSKKDMRRVD